MEGVAVLVPDVDNVKLVVVVAVIVCESEGDCDVVSVGLGVSDRDALLLELSNLLGEWDREGDHVTDGVREKDRRGDVAETDSDGDIELVPDSVAVPLTDNESETEYDDVAETESVSLLVAEPESEYRTVAEALRERLGEADVDPDGEYVIDVDQLVDIVALLLIEPVSECEALFVVVSVALDETVSE